MSTESQATNQQQSTSLYDERLFNERIRQIFNSIDSSTISHSALSPPLADTGPMASIVDALFPEQASIHQQQKQRDQQRHASTNDLTTTFERFPLWNQNTNSTTTGSASAFCGGTVNGAASAFANRRQGKLHSSTRSLRNGNYANHSTSSHYRPPPATRPRFTSSAIRLTSAATLSTPATSSTVPTPLRPVGNNSLQRSSSSSLSVNNGNCSTTEYQPRFASRLSNSRLPTVVGPTTSTGPVGSHDQIVGNGCVIDPIAPPSNSSSATAVLARSISSSQTQPTQQFVTMTQTTTTTFCYVPASGSLAYNTLPGATRSTSTMQHH